MITKKEINIFDTSKIEEGYFITYSVVQKSWEWDSEEEDEVPYYEESTPINGIILFVTEDTLSILQPSQMTTSIKIDRVIQNSEEEQEGIKILGIKKNAI